MAAARLCLAAVVLGGAATACGGGREAPAVSRYSVDGFSFAYPSSWHLRTDHNYFFSQMELVAYVSPHRLRAPCVVTRKRHPVLGIGTTTTCNERRTLRKLPPGGIFVSSYAFSGPCIIPIRDGRAQRPGSCTRRALLARLPGRRRLLAGRPAKVDVQRPGACTDTGADETIIASIPSGVSSYYTLEACLRAPGLEARRREFEAILASARLR